MSRVFPITVDLWDRDEPETFYVRANSRITAEEWLRDTLRPRLVRIHPPYARKKPCEGILFDE